MADEFRLWRNTLGEMPARAEAVCDTLTDDQLNWHPEGDRWSIAQCLDHLNRANGKIVRKLEEGVEQAVRSGNVPAGDWKPGMMEKFFIRMVGANAPMKSPVPPDFKPAERAVRGEVLPPFETVHKIFVHLVDEVERAGIVRVKIASPVTPLIKCSLGSWFAATIEHDSYHLGQAEAVRKELDAHVASSE